LPEIFSDPNGETICLMRKRFEVQERYGSPLLSGQVCWCTYAAKSEFY